MSPRPPGPQSSPPPRRPSGEERVFAAADGRLWGASLGRDPDGPESLVIVFTRVTEARQAMRAMVVDSRVQLRDVSDEMLRSWLAAAPAVGKLS